MFFFVICKCISKGLDAHKITFNPKKLSSPIHKFLIVFISVKGRRRTTHPQHRTRDHRQALGQGLRERAGGVSHHGLCTSLQVILSGHSPTGAGGMDRLPAWRHLPGQKSTASHGPLSCLRSAAQNITALPQGQEMSPLLSVFLE